MDCSPQNPPNGCNKGNNGKCEGNYTRTFIIKKKVTPSKTKPNKELSC